MIRREQNGIVWLEFGLLAQFRNLRHGVFLRHGGTSDTGYASLNISYTVGDDPQVVSENRERIRQILDIGTITSARQTHGKIVGEIPGNPGPCDALITQTPYTGIMIAHADCQAAILYDPVNHVAANVHSGWKGSAQNIYRETVERMKWRYGTLPENLYAGISPSLGPAKAEFIHYRKELPEPFWEFQVKPLHFDFWEISRWQLEECGVLRDHIEVAGQCTYSDPENFFSYRRDKVTGRHGTVVSLL